MKQGLFYDKITSLDCARLDENFGVIGESYFVNIEVISKPHKDGMIYDFSYFKKDIKALIDKTIDHRLVVLKNIKGITKKDDSVTLDYDFKDGKLSYTAPENSFCFLENEDSLESFIEKEVLKKFSFETVKVSLKAPNDSDETRFHYTHGLKNHNGNCQRLLHGHKGKIEIYINKKRDRSQEKDFFKRYLKESLHFAHKDDVKKIGDSICISYQSAQGTFKLTLPASHVFIMDEETTIENMTSHFLDLLRKDLKNKNINDLEIRACEGLFKGGIARMS